MEKIPRSLIFQLDEVSIGHSVIACNNYCCAHAMPQVAQAFLFVLRLFSPSLSSIEAPRSMPTFGSMGRQAPEGRLPQQLNFASGAESLLYGR